jgi:cytochrome c1
MRKTVFLIICLLAAVLLAGCASDTSALQAEIQEDNILKATGAYVGLSDNNTFEVQIEENTFKVFMLTEKTRPTFDKLKLQRGDKIAIDYCRNKAGQLETTKIERINESKDIKGKYAGSSGDTIEVKVSGGDSEETKTFTLSDKAKGAFDKLKLKENDTITINYTEDADGNPVVNSIKKAK